MWKAPYRPREHEISQTYNDGLVDVFREEDAAKPGYAPDPALKPVGTLAFEEQTLGLQRYYSGRQNQVQIERVLRVPRAFPVTSQMVAIVRGGETQYRIDLVQQVKGAYPASWDLTLARTAQVLPLPGGESHELE